MFNDLEVIGIAIVAGFATARVFGKLKIPAVAGYMVIGVLLGPSACGLFSSPALNRLDVVSDLALGVSIT
ncbi:MAG: hypothetical protein WCA32_06065 [Chromatiaceae bacterium]|jgi:Kef-type K+ transport system membrane component KefB